MAVLLITYDLNREVVRPNITRTIKGFGCWARLSESSYAVSTNLSADEIYSRLKPQIDGDDQIYIITLSNPWQGFGPEKVNQWLQDELGIARAA